MLEIDSKATEQHRQAWIEAEYQLLAWPRVIKVEYTEGFEKLHQPKEKAAHKEE